jgi:glucokinase
MPSHALVADLGGTNMRTAVVDEDGGIVNRSSLPTDAQQGRDDVVARLLGALRDTLSAVAGRQVIGIGVSVAGPTDLETGMMYHPPNLPEWHGFSVKQALSEQFGLPVSVANDASLAALAEHRYGAGRGYTHMVYLTISTGIGGGIIVDGELYEGAQGLAGEIGHMTIDRGGPQCTCGNVGCLEMLASGTAVARMARERLQSGDASVVLDSAGGDIERIDAAMVTRAARAGDEMAVWIVDEVARNLGIGIVGVVHALDPGVIVLGGGMTRELDLFMPGIDGVLQARAIRLPEGRPLIVPAQLGDDGGLLGAAAMALEASEPS